MHLRKINWVCSWHNFWVVLVKGTRRLVFLQLTAEWINLSIQSCTSSCSAKGYKPASVCSSPPVLSSSPYTHPYNSNAKDAPMSEISYYFITKSILFLNNWLWRFWTFSSHPKIMLISSIIWQLTSTHQLDFTLLRRSCRRRNYRPKCPIITSLIKIRCLRFLKLSLLWFL